MSADVLLTYGWVRSTYAALRNLTSHNLKVAVSDSARVGMCQQSRLKSSFHLYPNPFENEDGFINALAKTVNTQSVRVLIPSHDETEIIAKHRHRFSAQTAIPIPASNLLSLANNKARLQEFADGIGLPTAGRLAYQNLDELEKKIQSLPDKKWVVRLLRSNSAKGVFYAEGNAALLPMVASLIAQYSLAPNRYPLIQEYVIGEGYGVSCLYWEGEHVAHFTHRRLREKTATGGTSTLREHAPNPILEKMAFTLLSALKWHGLAMVEFKYNPQTKQGWLIELNPRLWGSIHLAIAAGVEFPYLLYLCATAGPQAAKQHQAQSKVRLPFRSRWYLGDCILSLSMAARLQFPAALKLLLPGGADTYDDISPADPGAFLGEILHYGMGFLKSGSVNPTEPGMLG